MTVPAEDTAAAAAVNDTDATALAADLTAARAEASAAADAFVAATVPEEFRALVPASLTPSQRIDWAKRATGAGLFKKPAPHVPALDAGKPKVTPLVADFAALSPERRMAAGYTR